MSEGRGPMEELKREGLEVYIYGAAAAGEATLSACLTLGVEIKGFFDDSAAKTSQTINGFAVHDYRRFMGENTSGRSRLAVIVAIADLPTISARLEGDGVYNWHSCQKVLQGFNYRGCRFSRGQAGGINEVEACLACHREYFKDEGLFIRSVDLVITERCSLRCRQCSNLMQYYRRPRDFGVDAVINQARLLLKQVDSIHEFRVIGGEPFMHREMHVIVDELAKMPAVEKVAVYSNATIKPRDAQLPYFRNSKIFFDFTDYGALSTNLAQIVKTFDLSGVAYSVNPVQPWTPASTFKKYNRSAEDSDRIWDECCAKNIITLLRGYLFRCPFSAHAWNLSAVGNIPEERIDLAESSDQAETRAKIKSLLKKNGLIACDYCPGRPWGRNKITPALQVSEPVAYRRLKEPVCTRTGR